jgi:hypothetical protein
VPDSVEELSSNLKRNLQNLRFSDLLERSELTQEERASGSALAGW